eukprot:scaffold730_cov365-Pinguiococcus_pyrenoidosus.AAC.2
MASGRAVPSVDAGEPAPAAGLAVRAVRAVGAVAAISRDPDHPAATPLRRCARRGGGKRERSVGRCASVRGGGRDAAMRMGFFDPVTLSFLQRPKPLRSLSRPLVAFLGQSRASEASRFGESAPRPPQNPPHWRITAEISPAQAPFHWLILRDAVNA